MVWPYRVVMPYFGYHGCLGISISRIPTIYALEIPKKKNQNSEIWKRRLNSRHFKCIFEGPPLGSVGTYGVSGPPSRVVMGIAFGTNMGYKFTGSVISAPGVIRSSPNA